MSNIVGKKRIVIRTKIKLEIILSFFPKSRPDYPDRPDLHRPGLPNTPVTYFFGLTTIRYTKKGLIYKKPKVFRIINRHFVENLVCLLIGPCIVVAKKDYLSTQHNA